MKLSLRRCCRNVTVSYALLLFFICSFGAFVFSFSGNILRELGLTDAAISLLTGGAAVTAFLLQLLVGELISRVQRLKTYLVLTALCLILILGAVLARVPGLPVPAAVAVYALINAITYLLYPLTNGLGMDSIARGAATNYSIARGMGSLGFASAAYGTGLLVRQLGIPVIYDLILVYALAAIFFCFHYHNVCERGLPPVQRPAGKTGHSRSFLGEYPGFLLFLIAAFFLQISQALLSNFIFQVMSKVHATAAQQGFAASLCALVELPIMFSFPLLRRRFSQSRLVFLGSLVIIVKPVIILMAHTPELIYLAMSTQVLGYGLFIISAAYYVEEVTRGKDSVRGQSYVGAAITGGSIAAMFSGGSLCQFLGVDAMILASLACGVIGSGVMLVSVKPWKNK